MDAKLTVEFKKIIYHYVTLFTNSNDCSKLQESKINNLMYCILSDCNVNADRRLDEDEIKFISNRLVELLNYNYDLTIGDIKVDILKNLVRLNEIVSINFDGFNSPESENFIVQSLNYSDNFEQLSYKLMSEIVLNMEVDERKSIADMIIKSCDFRQSVNDSQGLGDYPKYFINDCSGNIVQVKLEYIKYDKAPKVYYVKKSAEGHLYETHYRCIGDNCVICEGDLNYCVICGGAECDLTSQCPGHKISAEHLDLISQGKSDFNHNMWLANVTNCAKTKEEELSNLFYTLQAFGNKVEGHDKTSYDEIKNYYIPRLCDWGVDSAIIKYLQQHELQKNYIYLAKLLHKEII